MSEGSLSSGKKKMTKVEELLAKKNQIKALNSFNDNTGKRLRILRAQVHLPLHPLSLSSTPITFHHKQDPVVKIKDGVKDSFANILFGAAFAKALWATIHKHNCEKNSQDNDSEYRKCTMCREHVHDIASCAQNRTRLAGFSARTIDTRSVLGKVFVV